MNVVLAKLAICLVCLLLLVIAFSLKNRITDLGVRMRPRTWLGSLWILFRFIPFLIVYVIMGIDPSSDVHGFWYMATNAAEGKVVYRDFWSPYSPFFSYLLGLGALVWDNPRVVVLIMLLTEGLAVKLTWDFYKPVTDRAKLYYCSLIYFLLPGSLILSVIGAQEDVWIWLFITAAVVAGKRKDRIVLYSLILALGVLVTKAIFVLFLLPLFLLEKDKWRFSLPLAAVGVVSLGVLYTLVGDAFLQPVGEADTLRAPNLISILNPLFSNHLRAGEGYWNWTGLLITVTVGLIATLKWRNEEFEYGVSRIFVLMYATLMIVQQSAYSNYIFIFLLPLTFAWFDTGNLKQIVFLLLFNVLCAIHPSYWWRLGMPKYNSVSDIVLNASSLTDYSMQAAICLLTIGMIFYIFLPRKTAGK